MPRSPVVRLVILSAVLVACAAYAAKASATEPVPIRESFATFPMQLGPWTGAPAPNFTDRVLEVLGVDEYLNRTYSTNQGLVGLYVGYYRSQRQGDTIHSPLNCLPAAGWEPVRKDYLTLDVDPGASTEAGSAGRRIEINRYLIRKGLDREVVLYWYQSHGRVVANEYSSKVFMVLDAIRLNRTDAALVRVVSPVSDSTDAAEALAERNATDFVRLMFPLLSRYLPA
jgi:EpsI family protein